MKYFLSMVTLLLVVSTIASADEPPFWNEFEVWSSNRLYIAEVTVMDRNDKPDRWDWRYQLTVYKRECDANSKLWSCSYLYDGYTGGLLSDDGTTFVYVNFWYYENNPIVTIYQKGKLMKQITGKEFDLDCSKLTKTVSHRIWWHPNRDHRFVSTEHIPQAFEINTIDSQRFIVDLQSFEIKRQ